MELFNTQSGFCPSCGSIFPPLGIKDNIMCYSCKKQYKPDIFTDELEFTIQFNTYDASKASKAKESTEPEADGPTVDRKCPKCGHGKMSYATLQLRSADEGQTVFFTCLKCKFKESENS